MSGIEPNKPEDSRFKGLSSELAKIMRDPEFRTTLKQFRNSNETLFRVLKGFGFTLALASGLFGYFLKANSEADDRKVAMITAEINKKKEWYEKANKGVLELRKTRYLIKYDCDHGKALSLYEQGLRRFEARNTFVESFNGIGEVFSESLLKSFNEIAAFEEGILDVCAPNAPSDTVFSDLARKASDQMRALIQEDRQKLTKLSEGILSDTFLRF